jgi:hypothetical protein
MNVRGASLLIVILVAFSFNSLSATAEEAKSSGRLNGFWAPMPLFTIYSVLGGN